MSSGKYKLEQDTAQQTHSNDQDLESQHHQVL
jgi:hypothetical protein